MTKYKYIHVFLERDYASKFNPRVVEMINNPDNGFCIDEHLFVTGYKKVYQEICKYPNTVLLDVNPPKSAKVINQCAGWGEWFILHGIPGYKESLKINPRLWKRIIWRTWGHANNHRYPYEKGKSIKNIKNGIYFLFFKFEVKQFKVIGIANLVDEIDIRKRFGNVRKILPFGYPVYGSDEILIRTKENYIKSDDTVNILVGHSGAPANHHINIMNALEPYRNQNIRLYLVLAYGNNQFGYKEYIPEVKRYAETVWKEKAVIVDEFMKYEDYVRFLSGMDIAIFDGTSSYALGNIGILKYLEKKIYLNKAGDIRKAFDLEQIPYGNTKDIGKIPFSEFMKPVQYPPNVKNIVGKYETSVIHWHKLLEYLDES